MAHCYGTYYPPAALGRIDIRFETMVPNDMLRCTSVNGTTTCSLCALPRDGINELNELGFVLGFAVTLVFLGVFNILWRSMSRVHVDWYRILLIYSIFTWLFPVLAYAGEHDIGFSRYKSFLIVIHNLAECLFIFYIWFGRSANFTRYKLVTIPFSAYIYGSIMFIAFLRSLPRIYLHSMVQETWCDFMLVYSFAYGGFKMRQSQYEEDGYWWGAGSALLHLITMLPLFIGLAAGRPSLSGVTVALLVLPYMIYIIFAAKMTRRGTYFIRPPNTGIHSQLSRIVDVMTSQSSEKNIELDKLANPIVSAQTQERKNSGDDPDVIPSEVSATSNSGSSNDDDKLKQASFDLLKSGLVGLEGSLKPFFIILLVSLISALILSIPIWHIPCQMKANECLN